MPSNQKDTVQNQNDAPDNDARIDSPPAPSSRTTANVFPEDMPDIVKAAVTLSSTSYSSPYPHPDIIAGYQKAFPGSADRILKMVEKQSAHRIHMQQKSLDSRAGDSRLGLWLGFIIAMTVILGGIAAVLSGYPVTGSIMSLSSLTGLVGTFIYGSRQKTQTDQKKE